MGIVTSRFNLNSLHANGRRRSHQDEEQLYSYSLNKNYFSNYFFMGGERFEVSDPDYLFGDSCDLNFLTCSRPYSLPYKQAQQNLLTNLNTKQKAINKVSSRVSSLSSPLNILTGRHRQVSQTRKQDAQTQTANSNKGANGPEPSQPLVMLINIRKETLRLIKSSHACNLDSDQNSLTNTASISNTTSEQSGLQPSHSQQKDPQQISYANRQRQKRATKKAANPANRYSTTSSHATTVHPQDLGDGSGSGGGGGGGGRGGEEIEMAHTVYRSKDYNDSDTSSTTSNTYSSSQSTTASTSTGKSGYTSVRDVPPSECASDEGEFFEDALNEPSNLSTDNDSEKNQQKSLLLTNESTKETCDIKITIEGEDQVDRSSTCDIRRDQLTARDNGGANGGETSASAIKSSSAKILTKARSRKSPKTNGDKKPSAREPQSSNRVYNIEFTFDAEVDCSIRVSYFCTRVVSSNNVTYKPLHATYKSKTYTYKRGLNQKFEQQEHSFRPYLFDEDLLIYKPLDLDGNYNSGAVFPIVIHCVALEGPMPRQSQSLVATVEKSQLDDSYSIKPLKQMIFVDGVQYILQDIYGIENKPLTSSSSAAPRRTPRLSRQNLNSSCGSLYSLSNLRNSNMNLSETASINSVTEAGGGGGGLGNSGNRGSMVSNQYRSFGSENTFECVICMSEERDTMLLPCRHMCLCSSCAQSLRYQSSTCPICRCPFKAALNLRFTRRGGAGANRKRTSTAVDETEHKCLTSTITPTTTSASGATIVKSAACDNIGKLEQAPTRRESLTNSATPLLAASKPVDVRAKGSAKKRALDIPDAVVIPVEQLRSDRAGSGSVEVHNATGAAEDAEASEDAAGSGLKSMGVSASSPGAGGGACGGGGCGGGGASNKSGKAKGGGTASSRISPGEDHRRASAAAARRAPEDGNK